MSKQTRKQKQTHKEIEQVDGCQRGEEQGMVMGEKGDGD